MDPLSELNEALTRENSGLLEIQQLKLQLGEVKSLVTSSLEAQVGISRAMVEDLQQRAHDLEQSLAEKTLELSALQKQVGSYQVVWASLTQRSLILINALEDIRIYFETRGASTMELPEEHPYTVAVTTLEDHLSHDMAPALKRAFERRAKLVYEPALEDYTDDTM